MSKDEERILAARQRSRDVIYIGTELAGDIRREKDPPKIVEMVEEQKRYEYAPAKLHNARRAAIENPNTPTMYLLAIYIETEMKFKEADPMLVLGPGPTGDMRRWREHMPGDVHKEALAALADRGWKLTPWEKNGTSPDMLALAENRLEKARLGNTLRNSPSPYNNALRRTL